MPFESCNAIFRQGHFYDLKTNKRLQLKENTLICLVAEEGCFQEPKEIGFKPKNYRKPVEMEMAVKRIKELRAYWKVADAGTLLYFALDRKKHIFSIELQEDLYLYNCKDWKQPDDLYFYDCACTVNENINHSLNNFEPVYGQSLNDLFKTAYVHYLQNNGNSARNAGSVFFTDKHLKTKIETKKKEKRMDLLHLIELESKAVEMEKEMQNFFL